jgi:selenide, water dikinase
VCARKLVSSHDEGPRRGADDSVRSRRWLCRKIPPGELELVVAELMVATGGDPRYELLVGLDDGDDAAAVRLDGDRAIIVTPVVDDAYDWGRIAATNALSDVYAMGGVPLVALNLLGWPRDTLPMELAAEVLRGGYDICRAARCYLAGGHSIDDPEPKYGLAVTGQASPDRCCASMLVERRCRARAGPAAPGRGVAGSRTAAAARVFPAGPASRSGP